MLTSQTQVLALLCLTPVLSAGEWVKQAFPNWNDGLVLRLLTDSPWSRPLTVKLQWMKREERTITHRDIPGADRNQNTSLGPLGGIGAPKPKFPDKADLIVRWVSAMPLRQATALYRQREEKLDPSRLPELVGLATDDYVLEIFGAPVELAHSGAESVEAIAVDTVKLTSPGGRSLKPSKAHVVLQGETLAIRVHFSKAELVRLEDKELECTADFQIFQVKTRFKLGEMVYSGRLEI